MADPSKASKSTVKTDEERASGAFIGDACNIDTACRPGLACLSLYGDESGAYPNGLCTAICPKDTCMDDAAHGTSRCVQWPHEDDAICLIDCSAYRRCERDNYTCERVERSGESGTRYVCVPEDDASAVALQKITVDGTPTPLKGTVKLDEMAAKWKGSPITFATADQLSVRSAEHAAHEDEASVRDNDSTEPNVQERGQDAKDEDAERAEADDAPTESADAHAPNASAEETAAEDASANDPSTKDPSAKDTADERFEAQESTESESGNAPAQMNDSVSLLSVVIIVTVGAITLLTLLRMIASGRFGGFVRSVRDAAGEETALGRVRDVERKKRVHPHRKDQDPDIRVERRRSPVRPLRSIPGGNEDDQQDIPVLSRDTAIARKKIEPPTPEAIAAEAERAAEKARQEAATKQKLDEKNKIKKAPKKPPVVTETPAGPPAFSPDDLRTFSTLRRASVPPDDADQTSTPPERPSDGTPPRQHHEIADDAPPTSLRDNAAHAQLWSRARAARTFRVNRVSPSHAEETSIKDMDEFVAPLPIDIVLQLLDELLGYAENVRQRKGYDAIVYIETDPQKTIFRRGPEGEIRVQHAPDALAKPVLAVDAIRRKGFSPNIKVPDAHLLSLVHLGRYLLGSAAPDDVVVDIDALSVASSRFSDEELRLMRFLLAPEEHAHLQHLATSRGRAKRGFDPSKSVEAPPSTGTPVDWLPCPDCASEVKVGDLACGQCGTALHPRPIFCSACGTLNIPFADGRRQTCANIGCDQELLVTASGAEAEGQRLAIVADLLSSFDEFRRIPAPGNAERYIAQTQGRSVEIWQLATDRGTVLLEDDRPHYGLSDVFTLPHRCVEKSGVRFVIYDPPAPEKHPLPSLGPSKLAEGLLLLWEEVHNAKLRAPTLRFEDLSVSDSGDVRLLHGHVLRASTAATPRIHDTRFMAPELARQAIATDRTDLYTLAAIWAYAISGKPPSSTSFSFEDDAFIGASDLLLELMGQCLREDAADRPASVPYVLTQLRERRRLSDLI